MQNSRAVMALAAGDQASDLEKLLKSTRKNVLSDVSACAASVRRHLFASEPAPELTSDNSFESFAAAAESLECAEIARRVLKLASEGTPFDRMAILLRSPVAYVPVLERHLDPATIEGRELKTTREEKKGEWRPETASVRLAVWKPELSGEEEAAKNPTESRYSRLPSHEEEFGTNSGLPFVGDYRTFLKCTGMPDFEECFRRCV